MQRILYITPPDDPLIPLVKRAASGHLDIITASGTDLPASLSGFDALLVGDGPLPLSLSNPLQTAENGPRFIQLTRGHNRDMDIAAITASGVTVAGASPVLASYVARHSLSLALALRETNGPRGLKTREEIAIPRGGAVRTLDGLIVGVVGFGRVGQAMAEICASLGARVIYSDIRTAPHGTARNLRRSTLDLLLSRSDIVSLHVQWGPTSNPLIRERELRLIGKSSILVNTADARIVEKDSLAVALNSGHIAGAGLDIEDPDASELSKLPNTLVTPYVAARSEEADSETAEFTVGNIKSALTGGAPAGIIEILDFPPAGDPSFWSSKMAPRTV